MSSQTCRIYISAKHLYLPLITIGLLIFLAYLPVFYFHLHTDVTNFFTQSTQFLSTGTWQDMIYQEYQPASLWFILLPHIFSPNATEARYIASFVFVNAIILLIYFLIIARLLPHSSTLISTLLLIATGPILLFRLEPLVGLLVLLAWFSHLKTRHILAGIFVGLAIFTKLYAVILWPLMAAHYLIFLRQRDLFIQFVTATLIGIAIPLLPFLMLGNPLSDVYATITNFQNKPIGMDSMWGNLIVIKYQLLYKRSPPIDNSLGINGFPATTTNAPLSFFNHAWVIPTSSLLFALLWRYRHVGYADPLLPLLVLLVFLLFSKIINPQYLWWFASLLPLLTLSKQNKQAMAAIVGVTLVSLILTQLYYPIFYNQVLAWTNHQAAGSLPVSLSILRNGCLFLVLSLLSGMSYKFRLTKTPHPDQ